MSKQNIEGSVESRVCFEQLEDWVREKIQGWVQELLEEEVTELLGRGKSERRRAVDTPSGYRNGFGKPRHRTMSSGTIQVRRPRVRDLEERFESRVLPLFAKRTRQVRELIPELYLHGLALGDFDLALRGLLGDKAPLSASTVARLKEKWQAEWEVWQSRPLNDLEVVYLWVDGIYVKAGLEKEKAVLLVGLAALSDGSKAVVSVTSGYRESTQSWPEVLRDLKRRGMGCPRLVIGDGHLGIWGALRNVYPQAEEQRCWNHRIVNLPTSVCAALIADACNIALEPLVRKDTPALTRGRLSWIKQNYFRAETLIQVNAALVDCQMTIPLAQHWGRRRGRLGRRASLRRTGPNPRYFGTGRGVTYYNFTSDQFTGFHAIVVPGTIRDSLYVLDGLLEHETSLEVQEIVTDTAAYSDLIFGLFRLLGFQFSPRLADLGRTRFWRINRRAEYGPLNSLARVASTSNSSEVTGMTSSSWPAQEIRPADQDRQAIGHDPLDESHLALQSPGGDIARRVVQEAFTERVADAHHIPAAEGTVQIVVQLGSKDAIPLAVGIASEQRVAVGIQAEHVD